MAARLIIKYGDPVLREKSQPVKNFNQEIKDLVSDMIDTLKKANGLGLAAVQVGVLKRIFIVDLSAVDINATLKVFINPEIIEKSEEATEMEEGCLSFPGIYQKISRSAKVRIEAFDINGHKFTMEAEGLLARAFLHEYSHLEGELFIDFISPMARTMLRSRLKKLAQTS